MMLDRDIVAVSAASVYRVLKQAGLLGRRNCKKSKKGQGFTQPTHAHEHWHIDVSYINIAGTFFYFASIIDGYSRAIVEWKIGPEMLKEDIQILVLKARERHPGVTPRIISDNGPQFIALDFKMLLRMLGMSHARTSFFYPQSNGKIERFHKTFKIECIRPGVPLTLEDAIRIITHWILHYNTVRLHSAIGYVAPMDKMAGRDGEIRDQRGRKMAAARDRRKQLRQDARASELAKAGAGTTTTMA